MGIQSIRQCYGLAVPKQALVELLEAQMEITPSWMKYIYNKRFNYPANCVYCGRPGPWGNPFVVGAHGGQGECCDKFEEWLATGENFGCEAATIAKRQWILAHVHELRGKNLLCWCHPLRCHVRTLARLANV
jgi:hypothetical protein